MYHMVFENGTPDAKQLCLGPNAKYINFFEVLSNVFQVRNPFYIQQRIDNLNFYFTFLSDLTFLNFFL